MIARVLRGWREGRSGAAALGGKGIEDVAKMTPRALLFRGLFWRTHLDLLLMSGGTLLALGMLLVLLWPSADLREKAGDAAGTGVLLYLAPLILLLWPYGLWQAVRALLDLAINHAMAREIDRKAGEQIIKKQEIDLDRFDGFIIPPNDSDPTPAVRRLGQHVVDGARRLHFESATTVVQPYREESLLRLVDLQELQRFALRLGILGAFLGLFIAVQQIPDTFVKISKQLDQIEHAPAAAGTTGDRAAEAKGPREVLRETRAELIGLMRRIFSALAIKFGSSLAGLSVAISIALLAGRIRRRQETYFQHMEEATVTLTALARNARNSDAYLAEFRDLRTAMNALRERVQSDCADVNEQLRGVMAGLAQQTGRIEAGLERALQVGPRFDAFLRDIAGAQDRFLTTTQAFLRDTEVLYVSQDLRKQLSGVHEDVKASVAQAQECTGQAIQQAQEHTTQQVGKEVANLRSDLGQAVKQINQVHLRMQEDSRRVPDRPDVRSTPNEPTRQIPLIGLEQATPAVPAVLLKRTLWQRVRQHWGRA